MAASHGSSSVDVQGALVILDALEELRKIALAEAAAAASLLQYRRHRGAAPGALIHAADALDDLQEHRRPVR